MDAGLVEMIFSFGVVLAIAGWQLWTVWDPSRSETGDSEGEDRSEADTTTGNRTGD